MAPLNKSRKGKASTVYATAARLFAENGYHGTRIQDIADALGMLKGSLYYYFDSKEDLLVRITEGRVGEIFEAVSAIAETNYPPPQKLTMAIDEHLRLFQQDVHIYAIFTQENFATIDRKTAASVSQMFKRYERLWEQMLQEGIDVHAFAPDTDPTIVTKAILGMCNHTLTWFQPNGRLSIREIGRQFAQLILSGIQT